jgi:hypothetical protein
MPKEVPVEALKQKARADKGLAITSLPVFAARNMLAFAMAQNWRERLATERAEKYAPRPTGGAFMAGVYTAAVVLLLDIAFSAFYGWRVRDHLLIATMVTASGFVVGVIGYWRLAHLSRKARRAELTKIHHADD